VQPGTAEREAGPRLALLVADLEGGGAQRRMVLLANAFRRRGLAVDLVVVQPRGPLRAEIGEGVRLVSLERGWMRLPGVRSKKRRRVLASGPGLVAYLRRARPRALMPTSHSVCVLAAVASGLAPGPTRTVLRIDSHPSRAPALAGTRTQRRRLRRARRWFPRADALVAISEGVARDLLAQIELDPARVHVIHNPVALEDVLARAEESVAHPWLAPGEPPLVLAAGRLVAQKDLPTLLRAFARLRRLRPARLLILGEGPERGRLEALVRELGVAGDVELPGWVPNPYAYMARAAAFALSSAWEGFGQVLLEALACGCPAASTDCPSGPAEILAGGAFGPLVPVGDAAALARVLERLLASPPDPAPLRERARAFSIDRIAERYLEVLLG